MANDSPGPGTATSRGGSSTPEKKQLAQLLHNTVCQELAGICFLASAAALQHAGAGPEVVRKFTEIANLVQRAGAHLAEIVHDLHGPAEG